MTLTIKDSFCESEPSLGLTDREQCSGGCQKHSNQTQPLCLQNRKRLNCQTDGADGRTDGLRLEGKDTMATATATDRKGPMSTEDKQEREGEGFYIMLLSVGSL